MKLFKKTLVLGLCMGSVLAGTAAQAELSANAGMVSEYRFRGAAFGEAGAYAGVDFETSGFYAGVWAIDDSGDNEYDVYGGYSHEFDSGLSLGGGVTTYNYEASSAKQEEFNIYLGYDMFSLEITEGSDVDAGVDANGNPDDVDYSFVGVSVGGEVYSFTFGSFDSDADPADYDYFEFGAAGTIGDFDVALSIGSIDVDAADDADPYILVDIGKSFDL